MPPPRRPPPSATGACRRNPSRRFPPKTRAGSAQEPALRCPLLTRYQPASALRLLRLGGCSLTRAGVRLAIAPLAHERVELGAVLGRTASLQGWPEPGRPLLPVA